MTSYTPNRGYPFPSSPREAGNGGLHSELLARAAARDLDDVDTQWAAEQQHSTVTLKLNGDQTGHTPNNDNDLVLFDGAEHASSGLGLSGSPSVQYLVVTKGGDGWYHVTGSLRAGASGTVTNGALHTLRLRRSRFRFGKEEIIQVWNVNTSQAGTGDISVSIEMVTRIEFGETLAMYYQHNNASNMTIRQVGTSLAGTQIFRG